MLNSLPTKQKSKFKLPSILIVAPMLCILLIGIATFANDKEKQYTLEINSINTELETLKLQESKLKSKNDLLIKSKMDLEKLFNDLK